MREFVTLIFRCLHDAAAYSFLVVFYYYYFYIGNVSIDALLLNYYYCYYVISVCVDQLNKKHLTGNLSKVEMIEREQLLKSKCIDKKNIIYFIDRRYSRIF